MLEPIGLRMLRVYENSYCAERPLWWYGGLHLEEELSQSSAALGFRIMVDIGVGGSCKHVTLG